MRHAKSHLVFVLALIIVLGMGITSVDAQAKKYDVLVGIWDAVIATDGGDFQKVLKSLITQVDSHIKEAEQKTEEFVLGKRHDLHEIMIASEKADLSFQFLVQIRNKLIEAYSEIMRMSF